MKLGKVSGYLCIIGLFLLISSTLYSQLPPEVPGLPPFPENPLFDIQLANIYVNLIPQSNEAQITMTLWLVSNDDPVVVKIGGNLMNMIIHGDQQDLEFIRVPPYYHFNNLKAGSHQITFIYSIKYDGITTQGVISDNSLTLDATSFWYPKNIASDPHQALLTIETPANYPLVSNAKLEKETPNNLKTLRQYILSVASDEGLTLSQE